jgi:hypothetical protein
VDRSRVYHSPFFNSPIFSVNYAINEEVNSIFTDRTEAEIFVKPQGKVWGDSIPLRRISPKEAQKTSASWEKFTNQAADKGLSAGMSSKFLRNFFIRFADGIWIIIRKQDQAAPVDVNHLHPRCR